MDVRICVVFLVLGGTYALTGKGFYCRDPDTGKLHAFNTTWKSTTFCGNYTCRLKKKDVPTTPLREFKISEVGMSKTESKSTDIKDSGQDRRVALNPATLEKEDKRIAAILNKLLNNITDPNEKRKVSDFKDDLHKADRYLNDKEIKMIADLLHSVKKSDLETVIDIYNIAQDIYKELDNKTSETIVEEAASQTINKGHDKSVKPLPNMGHNQLVYGFEPMHISQKAITEIKNQEREILTDTYQKIEHNELTNGFEPMQIPETHYKIVDMNKEGSDVVPLVYLTPKLEDSVPTFNSPLASPGYVKLPYYYDLSDFQRQASYINPYLPVDNTEKTVLQPVTEKTSVTTSKPVELKNINQPILLPYPYYQVRYNATGYPFNYFYGVNPYQDVYRKEYNPYYVTRTSYSEKVKTPERSYKPGALIDKLLPKDDSKTTKMPDWKTESLSDDVLDDIRAHFENKNILFKPLCLKKKIKLEKVGKVFKLDDFNRQKRSTSLLEPHINKNDDVYEVYVEKTICQSDVDPGFFRMGNTSAPFPACCPQRITR